MLEIEKHIAGVWTLYGQHQLGRTFNLPELDDWDWDIPQAGPGIDVLGEVAGLRVLDLGAGVGRHAAHLASLGAHVTAVDASPTQHQRALTRYPDAPGLRFVCADAVDHLRKAEPYDLIYSVSSTDEVIREAEWIHTLIRAPVRISGITGPPVGPVRLAQAPAGADTDDAAVQRFLRRLKNVHVARSYVMMDYDIRMENVEAAIKLTPGLESPTVSPLHSEGWAAVRAMVPADDAQLIMDKLEAAGARAILTTRIHACRMTCRR